MAETLSRSTAYKVWIADLIRGDYIKGEGQFDSGHIFIKNKKVSRVNLISSVVDKYSGDTFGSLTLDDGSGVIALKAWNENTNLFLELDIGDLVLIIGKIKYYANSIYVTPEIVRKLDDPSWLKARKSELVREYGEVERMHSLNETKSFSSENNMEDFEEIDNTVPGSRERVVDLIENLDNGEGAELVKIIEKSDLDDIENIIKELLQDGEIFELTKNRFRVMD